MTHFDDRKHHGNQYKYEWFEFWELDSTWYISIAWIVYERLYYNWIKSQVYWEGSPITNWNEWNISVITQLIKFIEKHNQIQ